MALMTLHAARNVDFAPSILVSYSGDELPLTGASISMQVRLYPGAAGDPLAEATDIGFVDEVDSNPERLGWRLLTLSPIITKSVLTGLPGQNTPDPGDKQTYAYEIKITYADSLQDSLLNGDFLVAAGVDAT